MTCPWPPDFAEVLAWQWDARAIPYWREEAERAGAHGVRGIGLEMHPGFLVYNPETLLRLRAAAGERVGANFDPSHLVWQGIDAIDAVRELGRAGDLPRPRQGHVRRRRERGGATASSTRSHTTGCSTARGRSARSATATARSSGGAFVSMLRLIGYDGVLSIEHEDALASVDEGIEKAVALLRGVLLREPAAEMWWS